VEVTELQLLREIADKADLVKNISQNACGLCSCSFCENLKRKVNQWKKEFGPSI